jgi:hypothetical protein
MSLKKKTLTFWNYDVTKRYPFAPVIVFNAEQYESFEIREITESIKADMLANPDHYIM